MRRFAADSRMALWTKWLKSPLFQSGGCGFKPRRGYRYANANASEDQLDGRRPTKAEGAGSTPARGTLQHAVPEDQLDGRRPPKAEAAGSTPAGDTQQPNAAPVAQREEARGLDPRQWGFESLPEYLLAVSYRLSAIGPGRPGRNHLEVAQ